MNFFVFLGALILLAGASILLDALFHIHLPLVRSAFALLFIFIGVRILFDAWGPRDRESSSSGAALLSNRTFVPNHSAQQLKYDVVFGRGDVDLTQLPKPERPTTIEINAIFGSAFVRIDPEVPTVVEANSAFGQVQLPDAQVAAFGNSRYRPKGQVSEPLLTVRVTAVFGSVVVTETAIGPTSHPHDLISQAR